MSNSTTTTQNNALYKYDPSVVTAAIFAALFTLTTGLHLFQIIRSRTFFMIAMAVGGFFELIGYIFRAINANETPNWKRGPYIIQTVLILLAPALFAASIYMEFGRIILVVDGEARAIVKQRWLTRIFVCGDVLSFLIQAVGGSIMTGKSHHNIKLGQDIILVGLFFQVLWFGFFVLTALIFNRRILKDPTQRSALPSIPWRKHLNALYISSILIMIRSIFRVIAYIQGNRGYFLTHEWYLYALDAILMLGVMVMFNKWHPSELEDIRKGKTQNSRGDIQMT